MSKKYYHLATDDETWFDAEQGITQSQAYLLDLQYEREQAEADLAIIQEFLDDNLKQTKKTKKRLEKMMRLRDKAEKDPDPYWETRRVIMEVGYEPGIVSTDEQRYPRDERVRRAREGRGSSERGFRRE